MEGHAVDDSGVYFGGAEVWVVDSGGLLGAGVGVGESGENPLIGFMLVGWWMGGGRKRRTRFITRSTPLERRYLPLAWKACG